MSNTHPINSNATQLDTTGLICPEPVMLLHQAIRKAKGGDCIELLATDPSTQRDVPRFCQHLGHKLLDNQVRQVTAGTQYLYVIEKVN